MSGNILTAESAIETLSANLRGTRIDSATLERFVTFYNPNPGVRAAADFLNEQSGGAVTYEREPEGAAFTLECNVAAMERDERLKPLLEAIDSKKRGQVR